MKVMIKALLCLVVLASCEISNYPYYLQDPPMNISLVLDRSGSMGIETMNRAKDAAVLLVEHMNDGDSISVVAFESSAELIVPAAVLSTENRPAIQAAIQAISSGGGTSVSSGLTIGYEQLEQNKKNYFFSSLILLCDGDVDMQNSRPLVEAAAARGIISSTISIGVNAAQAADMQQLANYGAGVHVYVGSGDSLFTAMNNAVNALFRPF